MGIFLVLIAITLAIRRHIALPAQMAVRRDRSALGWVVISMIFSPLVAIIALLVLGPPYRQGERK